MFAASIGVLSPAENVGIYVAGAVESGMETATASDKGVGFAMAFGLLAILGAIGLAIFGTTGDQTWAGLSFGVAMVAGSLAVAAYHVYG